MPGTLAVASSCGNEGCGSSSPVPDIDDQMMHTPNGLRIVAVVPNGNWADALDARFDLVLCNPPYIRTADLGRLMPEVARHEPASALPVIDRLHDIPVKTLVRTEVSPQGLDAYVIVTKASSRYGSRGHTVSGHGAAAEPIAAFLADRKRTDGE